MGAKDAKSTQELFELCRKGDAEKLGTWLQQRAKRSLKSPLKFLRNNTHNSSGTGGPLSTPSVGAEWLSCMREPSTSYTALHQAALTGHVDVVTLLLAHDPSLVRVSDRRGCRALHLAAWAGHSGVVERLLTADPGSVNVANNAKELPLHLAALHGHAQIAHYLLQKGADARLRNARFETPLDIGARTGKADICRVILARCPELILQSATDCASTSPAARPLARQVVYPLHLAARYGNADCVEVLCAAGFDVNYVTDEGTALHVAAAFGQAPCVALLLEHAADPHIRDADGRTALERLRHIETQRQPLTTHAAQSAHGWLECRQLIQNALGSPNSRATYRQLPPDEIFVATRNGADGSMIAAVANSVQRPSCDATVTSSTSAPSPSMNTTSASHSEGRVAPEIFPRTPANAPSPIRLQKQNGTPSSSTSSKSTSNSSGASLNLHPNALLCRYQVALPAVYRNAPNTTCECRTRVGNGAPTTCGAYDNAPPPNCRNTQWNHHCCPPIVQNAADACKQNGVGFMTAATVGAATGRRFDAPSISTAQNTMPHIRPTPPARASVLRLFATPANAENVRTLADVLDEMTLSQTTTGLTDSATTSGFSTLEKVANYDDDFDTNAPIALPEELDGSTYAATSTATSGVAPFPTPAKRTIGAATESSTSPTSTLSASAKNSNEILDARGVDEGDTKAIMRRNHSAEWRKIDEILTSIQRESFFGGNLTAGALAGITATANANCDAASLELWLRLNVGIYAPIAQRLAVTLETNGFDSVQLLKGSLNRNFLTEMGVEQSVQDQLLAYLGAKMPEMIPSVEKFEYLSDWLDALDLIDHLGAFASANLTHTPEIIAARLTRTDLEKMGIRSLGHIARIVRSLELISGGENDIRQAHSDSKTDFLRFLGSVQPPPVEMLQHENGAAPTRSAISGSSASASPTQRPDACLSTQSENVGTESEALRSLYNDGVDGYAASFASLNSTQRQHLLLDECISFSAHYLGSTEISNVEGAADCRRAMNASKKRVKQVNKLPQVILEISIGGVNVLDASTNQLTVQHEVGRIEVVCQDELDLNCFAYIFQDGEKHFCHVYCVLTADVAKEIIVTLGEAFNMAYALLVQNGNA